MLRFVTVLLFGLRCTSLLVTVVLLGVRVTDLCVTEVPRLVLPTSADLLEVVVLLPTEFLVPLCTAVLLERVTDLF